MKIKVTRSFIADRALMLAMEHQIDFKANGCWVSGFMDHFGFSLRRTTNLTTLSDDQLIQRGVDYMKYLQSRLRFLSLEKTLLMDETALYFEDSRTQTVDLSGHRHVVIKSTGFASMRITVAISIWADGRKGAPLVIHKGKPTNISRQGGPILYKSQECVWVDQKLIINWIDGMFLLVDTAPEKAIVWDSCRSHIAKSIKEHCKQRNIELIVIPGGLTPYLQAGDIGIFKSLKDHISAMIHEWKISGHVEYTKGENPKPPANNIVWSWVLDAWRQVALTNIKHSISSAGFSNDYKDWHISKHDVYGDKFRTAWENCGDVEASIEDLEEIPQDDEILDCIDE